MKGSLSERTKDLMYHPTYVCLVLMFSEHQSSLPVPYTSIEVVNAGQPNDATTPPNPHVLSFKHVSHTIELYQ